MNDKFLKNDTKKITVALLKRVLNHAKTLGHNSYAPLGCSGDTFILYGTSRRQEISLRLHSGDVKLLITDNAGGFLFNGGFDTSILPVSFIAEEYHSIIQKVKYLLENTSTNSSIIEKDKEKMFRSKEMLNHMCGYGMF